MRGGCRGGRQCPKAAKASCQHTSEYVRIRPHKSAYVSIYRVSRVRATACARTSTASACACGHALSSASDIAPDPGPTSRKRRGGEASERITRSTSSSVSGRGISVGCPKTKKTAALLLLYSCVENLAHANRAQVKKEKKLLFFCFTAAVLRGKPGARESSAS